MTKFDSRKLFTKVRISAHDLLIERGRYRQQKLELIVLVPDQSFQLRTDYVASYKLQGH